MIFFLLCEDSMKLCVLCRIMGAAVIAVVWTVILLLLVSETVGKKRILLCKAVWDVLLPLVLTLYLLPTPLVII